MAGSVIIQGQLTQIPAGNIQVGPFIIVPNTANNFAVTSLTLASGNNSISVPSWASGVIINPSTANLVLLTLKGANADTGVPLGIISPTLLNFDVPPANIVISAAGAFSTVTEFIFF